MEVRQDPLTGASTRVAHFGSLRGEPRPVEAEEESVCPFCPPLVEEVTPRFPSSVLSEGQLVRGAARLFPNLNPYDEYSAVVTIGEHVERPGIVDPGAVTDALMLARELLRRLPRSRHGLLGWNYLPAAGASLLHPHLHVVASRRRPDWQAREAAGEARFARRWNRPFWPDLVAAERNGERWLGEVGGVAAVVAFAPRGVQPDVLLVVAEAPDLASAAGDVLRALAAAIAVASSALASLGVGAWNLVAGPGTRGTPTSALHLRIIPRRSVVERHATSDQNWIQVCTGDAVVVERPERWAEELRATDAMSQWVAAPRS